MSKQSTRALDAWNQVRTSLAHCSFLRDNRRLSDRDAATWADCLTMWGILTEDLGLSSEGSSRTRRWVRRLASIDVLAIGRTLKVLDGFLTSWWDSPDEEFPLAALEQGLYATAQADAGAIIGIIAGRLRSFATLPTIESYRTLHQWAKFLNHVSLRDIDCPEVVEEFVNWDERLGCHANTVPERVEYEELLQEMQAVLAEWLRDFAVSGKPKHGPGSTADAGRGWTLSKYLHVGVDNQLLPLLSPQAGYRNFDLGYEEPTGFEYTAWERRAGAPIRPWSVGFSRISRLVSVPKTILTRRTICAEPATLQYYQQMVASDLDRLFRRHPFLRRVIHLHDQSFNRDLAREGSLAGDYATLDLSKASDSVSWDLVRSAFAGTPLLPWLAATRSVACELPSDKGAGRGRVIALRKFASMGSALTFPVECLVFAAVCEVAAKRKPGTRCKYYVYGDDIVITEAHADEVMRCLSVLGFVVNRDKSFYRKIHCTFRESCGGEFVNGVDVAPLMISRRYTGDILNQWSPHAFQGLVSFANALLERNYLKVRSFVIQKFRSLPVDWQPPLTRDPRKPGLVVRSERIYGRTVRWNADLQRYEQRAGYPAVVVRGEARSVWVGFDTLPRTEWSKVSKHDLSFFPGYTTSKLAWLRDTLQVSEIVRYHHWFVEAEGSLGLDPVISDVDKIPSQQLVSGWCPVDDLGPDQTVSTLAATSTYTEDSAVWRTMRQPGHSSPRQRGHRTNHPMKDRR